MRKRMNVAIPARHPVARLACLLMALSAAVRLWHYLPQSPSGETLWLHLVLPVAACAVFLAGVPFGGKRAVSCAVAATVLGVTFFILKAAAFAPVHRTLCTILYLTVLALFTAALLGILPTKKLLYPLFGLPLLYHIFVEDTQLYFFADPPVPVWDWMPEISVLLIMGALLSLSFALKTEKIAPRRDG